MVVLLAIIGIGVWNFYWRAPKIEPASIEKMALPLPDLPSIAVLPFKNMSEDPKQEIFCDGITEEIITGLSKVPEMFVIARNSSFTYKGKPTKVQQVAQDLGVKYVLEGSVRRSQENLRVTAQLIDAIKGHNLWADRWDRELKDVFAIQDEITLKIITAMQVKLTSKDQARILAKGTNNLDAYLKVLEANELVVRFNQESNLRARQLSKEAIELDHQYAVAYTILGKTHMLDVWLGTSGSPKESMAQGIQLAQRAIEIDGAAGRAHGLLGFLYTMTGQHDRGIVEAEKAIALEPNSDLAYQYLGLALRFGGKPNEAIPVIKKAIRLNPFAPSTYVFNLGLSYLFSGQYEEGLAECEKATAREPKNLGARLALTIAYSFLNRDEAARASAEEVLRIDPKFFVDNFSKTLVYKNEADKIRFIDALRKAGLPDKPPMSLPDKPSIAVLPFTNMSDDQQQEYFSDGISEDIITDLSKISGLIVIARNSSFTYKGKSVNAQQIGQDLRVRYLLEGSVRKAGNQVRINAQLIDASNGQHLWAERYDGKMDDIFALQDKITHKIISALALKLTANEEKSVVDKGTDNLQAYDEFLKGWQSYRLLTKEGFAEAKIHLEKAVELDPEFARAYAALAVLYQKAIDTAAPGLRQGLGVTSHAELDAVRNKPQLLLKKAMKKPTALAHGLMSQFYLTRYRHDEALAEIERAVAMDPNDPELYAWMSNIFYFMGKNSEAIESAKMGQRLDPNNPTAYLIQLAKAYLPDENIQESLQLLEKAKRLNPDLSGLVALYQAILYGVQGQNEEARTAYEIFLKSRMTPVRSLNDIMPYFPFADAKKLDSFAAALIKAGVPGNPTDYQKILKENRLNGQEVKSLLFGRKITGISIITGEQFWWEWAKSGEFKVLRGAYQDAGKSWIEGDVIFSQFEKQFGGIPYGSAIFRNPDGSKERGNEYYMVNDMRGISPFATVE